MRKKQRESDIREGSDKTSTKPSQLDIISKINDLKILAESSLLNKDYDNAVDYAEKVIRIGIKKKMQYIIEEEDQFLEKVAEVVQEEYFVNEIEEAGKMINKIYDILITSGNVNQAHEILESFKNHYSENPFFNSIPLIQNLLKKDKKEWFKYTSSF